MLRFPAHKLATRETDMKILAVTVALTAVLFIAPAFTDHNRTDEQGRKQGHWTEFPNVDGLLAGEGNYVDGKRHGRWVLRLADGAVHEGPFVNGEAHGNWVVRLADGGVQEGPMVNGERHGEWVSQFADGSASEGYYVDGEMHGQWVTRTADGHVFEGPYVSDKRHGR